MVQMTTKADFAAMYETCVNELYRFALYYLGSPEEAEDAVQETALEAFRSRHTLREKAKFKAWIFAILAAKCKRSVKGLILKRSLASLAAQEGAPDGDLLKAVEIREAVAGLSPEERLIILLAAQGFKGAEIASILAKPEGTVRSKRSRALEKLKGLINS
jgi:RNA polymerase sigma-70 factor (ECF subfamily)